MSYKTTTCVVAKPLKILNGLTYTCDGTGVIINKSYGGGSFEGRGNLFATANDNKTLSYVKE